MCWKEYCVQRSQAHGGQLTGDAACRFFNIPIDMWRAISPRSKGDEERTVFHQWCQLLEHMSYIHRLIMRPTPLCDHEVGTLTELCNTVAAEWHVHFKGEPVFPKLHVVCIDLPRFVQQHRTVTCQ